MRNLFALTAAASDRLWDLLVALAPILAPAIGGGVIAWMRARRRRLAAQSAARAKDRAVLYAVAELVLVIGEDSLSEDWLRATGQHLPIEEQRDRRADYRARKRAATDLLRGLLDVTDRRTGPRDTQRLAPVDARGQDAAQDMFAVPSAGDDDQ